MLGSLEDTLIMSQIENVYPCLDFAHLHARPGDGTVNSYDEWSNILEQYAAKLGEESLQYITHPPQRDRIRSQRGEKSPACSGK